MSGYNSLPDRQIDGSRKAAINASLDGKTAMLRMKERLGNAISIDEPRFFLDDSRIVQNADKKGKDSNGMTVKS